MPKAVIFDIDGTLVDSVKFHAEAWVLAFEAFGYTAQFDQMRHQIGKGGEFILADFLSEAEIERDGEKISEYRRGYFQAHFLPQIRPFPQVKALFEQLRADGLQLVLASSAQPETVEYYVKLLDVRSLIRGTTSTGDVEHAKPNPDVFEAALQHMPEVSPSEVIVVGDSPYDAMAACKIALPTVGVLSGGFSAMELRAAGCIAIYDDPADLLAHYTRSPLHPNASHPQNLGSASVSAKES